MPQPNALEIRNLSLSFGDKTVLDNINLTMAREEKLALVGPSGSGKSTLIKLVAGLIQPNAGEIIRASDNIALAFQYGALFTSMTVADNLSLVLEHNTDLSDREMEERINEALKTVGLEQEKDAYPSNLSGGMQKRVGIARALAIEPDLLMYDEPSAGLDPILANKLEQDLQRINDEHRITAIIVTHELTTIANMAERVVMLYQGKFVFDDTTEAFFRSDDPYAVQFRERRAAGPIAV